MLNVIVSGSVMIVMVIFDKSFLVICCNIR